MCEDSPCLNLGRYWRLLLIFCTIGSPRWTLRPLSRVPMKQCYDQQVYSKSANLFFCTKAQRCDGLSGSDSCLASVLWKWVIPDFFFVFLYNFTTKVREKCPFRIWRRDLNPQPSDHESPPITTRPGLPSPSLSLFEFSNLQYMGTYHMDQIPIHGTCHWLWPINDNQQSAKSQKNLQL